MPALKNLEDLRKHVADLFGAATDKTTIEKSAVVVKLIDDAEADIESSNKEHEELLKNYKDVVIHSNFKSDKTADQDIGSQEFDGDATWDKIINDIANGEKK